MRARRSARRAAASLAAALGALVPAGTATGVSQTITVPGWHDHTLAFAGPNLVIVEAATVRVDPRAVDGAPPGARRFDYYRAEAFRAPLVRARTRFAGRRETLVSIRTSIARMGSGVLSGGTGGRFVMAPAGRAGSAPVVWCCDDEDVELVVHSDGRAEAPVALAAAEERGRARVLLAHPDGRHVLLSAGAGDGARAEVPVRTSRGRVALAPGLVAWADPGDPAALMTAPAGDAGLGNVTRVALPGTVLRVWAAPRLAVAAVRHGARVAIVRVDLPAGTARVVWSGPRMPRVAAGGGSVAVADGRRVLAGRRGPLRPVRAARGRVSAVAVHGPRVAWLERLRVRGSRASVARLGVVR